MNLIRSRTKTISGRSVLESNGPNAPSLEKFLVIPGLLLTTILATGLFATRFDHWASSARFADFVVSNRSAVGIVVQVISHLLGM